MEILNKQFKILEFEFSLSQLENSTELITNTFCESEIYSKKEYNENKVFDYGLRSRTLITNKTNNNKVFVYESELRANLKPIHDKTSTSGILDFVKKAFSNHEKYFFENKSKELKINNINIQHEINSYSLNVFSHLKNHGLNY
ncbi:hypothetical protein K8354_16190 [Polaribacter litorisediminis]|uniref:hypothetical protein n=1 Tax=Polaribacter litorisediminis TaxID=1908341 RepID=UPI001CBF60C6|nr:hypothetical protein [Polaribacter litorisediminis]UAM97810.1 hypothetical protein K8354_16190 [Polaribacter litorisediminis]